jgi:UPF0716 protein FxsA
MPLFRFFLLLLPLLELATLILLGQRIGVGYTLLWVLGSGVLGLVLIQRQGWSMLQQLQIRMAENRSPFAVLKTGDALALPCLVLALVSRGKPGPGEPGGPNVWRRGSTTIIEGEWRPDDPDQVSPDRRIDRE